MNPTNFRPSKEVRKLLAMEQADRPGVPLTYILNEKLAEGFAASGRRLHKRSSRGAAVVEGGAK